MKKSVIICMGNELRGDDGVALLFYERLRKDDEICKLADVIKIGSAVTLKPLEQAGRVIVVDAVDFRGRAGEIKVFVPDEIDEIAGFTHKPAMRAILKSAKVSEVYVVGIQPKSIEIGEQVSRECVNAYPKVRQVVMELLSSRSVFLPEFIDYRY